VELGAIRENSTRLKAAVSPASVLAIVKADGYGHGAVSVARALEPDGVAGFGVATVEEAIELRDASIRAPILVLGGVYGGAHAEVVARGLEAVVFEAAEIERFADAARRVGRKALLHVKVDTGMARLGAPPTALADLLDRAARRPEVQVRGLATHFSCADDDDPTYTRTQIERFSACLAAAEAAGARPPLVHAANSAAALRYPECRHDAVRLGLLLYGALPSSGVPDPGLRPALSLRTRVASVRTLSPGEAVGYGALWRASRPSLIATLPVGYADGYSRRLGGRAEVILRGRRAGVVGAVAMDMIRVDATDGGAAIGDEATLLGEASGQRIRVEDMARWADTIPYEILCALGRRLPRVYLE
jgi:alanine racemase